MEGGSGNHTHTRPASQQAVSGPENNKGWPVRESRAPLKRVSIRVTCVIWKAARENSLKNTMDLWCLITSFILFIDESGICFQDDLLAHTSFKKDLASGNVSKPWVSFIRKFNFEMLSAKSESKSLVSLIFTFFGGAKCFDRHKTKYKAKTYELMKVPLGHNETFLNPALDFHLWWTIPRYMVFRRGVQLLVHNILFQTHPTLRLNMTIILAVFQKLSRACVFHNFTVVSRFSATTSQICAFCGILAGYLFYPPSSSVKIQPNVLLSHSRLEAFVIVMSADVIENRHGIYQFSFSERIHFIVFTKMWIFTYKFQLRKDLSISVRMKLIDKQQLLLFDGPGLRSEKVETHRGNNTFKAQSYQCIIQIASQKYIMLNQTLYYWGDFLSFRKVFTKKANNVTIAGCNNSKMNFCAVVVIQLLNPPGAKCNITVQEFIFRGQENTDCTFGGFAVVEPENGTLVEAVAFCNNRTSVAMNIFAAHSSKVVIYSYKQYSSLSAVIRVSHTVCRVTSVHPCDMQKYSQTTRIGEGIVYIKETSLSGIVANLTQITCAVLDISVTRRMSFKSAKEYGLEKSVRLFSDACNIKLYLKSKKIHVCCSVAVRVNISALNLPTLPW